MMNKSRCWKGNKPNLFVFQIANALIQEHREELESAIPSLASAPANIQLEREVAEGARMGLTT